jgi:purine-binding chemotaxis protein CheW
VQANHEISSSGVMDARGIRQTSQFSTFFVSGRLYGIDVTRVQEVVRPMAITPIPLAPEYVTGLINLRGQVATAIGLRQLFGLMDNPPDLFMNVVCKFDGALISLQVDEIGDVIDVSMKDFEPTPQTVPQDIRRFMSGIYKISSSLLSIIDVDRVNKYLNHKL